MRVLHAASLLIAWSFLQACGGSDGTTGTVVPTVNSIRINGGDAQSAQTGSAVSVPPSVVVVNAAGQPVSGVAVSFTVVSGGGTLAGASQATNASGIATLGSWTLGAVGTNSVSASIAGGGSVTFTAVSTQAVGTPATISLVTGDKQVVIQFNPFIQPITVLVKDANGTPVPNAGVVYTVTAGQGKFGTGTVATGVTNANGLSSMTWTSGIDALQSATVSVNGLAPIAVTGRTVSLGSQELAEQCALSTTGAVACWGSGVGTKPTALTGGVVFASLADGGGVHSCGLTASGQAYCWGSNLFGELGDGTTTAHLNPSPVTGQHVFTRLAVSLNASCGVKADGSLYCWGFAGYGLFGDGDQGTTRLVPTLVNTGGVTFASISLGRESYCGLNANGSAYCWGRGPSGAVGDGALTTRGVPTLVAGGRTYSSITVGGAYACALTTSSDAYCWGGNASALGNGGQGIASSPVPVSGGLKFSFLRASNSGQTCALDTTAKAYCWGSNFDGLLGNGTTTNASVPTAVMGDISFTSLFLGHGVTCGVSIIGQPYCWGDGVNGDLGDQQNVFSLIPSATAWIEGVPGRPVSLRADFWNLLGPAGGKVTSPVFVRVADYLGAPVAGVSVTFTIVAGGGSISAPVVTTDANGVATLASWTLGGSTASRGNLLTATVAQLPGVLFSGTGH